MDQPGTEVANWEAWKDEIEKRSPSLLILLSHTGFQNSVSSLEIGRDDVALLTDINEKFVGRPTDGKGPVVLLLGCSTATGERAFQSFVTQSRRAGAAVVVGTLCEILGRQAAPIAQALTEKMFASRSTSGKPLGELLMQARRDLLAAGYPIILTVVAFGDADWLI